MPEGDTIYRSARAMQRALGGKLCTGFETGLAPLARVNDDTPLAGRTIEKVESRGKWLLVHFSGDLILVTHMLMSGSWHLYRAGEKWWMGRGPYARRDPRRRGRRRLAGRRVQRACRRVPHRALARALYSQIPKLGIDALGEEYTVERGVASLRAYGEQHPEA